MAAEHIKLLCIRHGQTDWNLEGRYCGQSDIPLNETGSKGARDLAHRLKDATIHAIYSSDLMRAYDTAGYLAEPHGLSIQQDPRLREINQGVWEGMLFNDIKEQYAQEFSAREQDPVSVAPPGGETVGQVRKRVIAALDDIAAKHQGGETVAVVAHGFTLAITRVHIGGIDIREVWDYIPPNTEVIELEFPKK